MGIFVPQRDVSQTPRMHRHMENPNFGPRDPIYCFGIQDTVFQSPCSKISTSHPSIGSRFNPCFSGSERITSKRGYQNYTLYKRRVLQSSVSCPQKGWTFASGDRPECSKQVLCKRSFPDGKSKLLKDVAFARGFYDKYRFKRRMPVSCCSRTFTKVPQFYLGGEMLPIQSSPIRPVLCSEDIYQTVKTGCGLPKKEGIRVLIYLDDFLLLAQTKEEATRNTQMLVTLLQSLGFTVNLKKSSLTPTQMITFLGFSIDSRSMMIVLPVTKVQKILECCQKLTASQTVTLRSVASLIGLLESCRPAIWRTSLHFGTCRWI